MSPIELSTGVLSTSLPFLLEEDGQYTLLRPASREEIIAKALALVAQQVARGAALESPSDCRAFLALALGTQERELFYCIYLDNQHRILQAEVCFLGTINSASVHPREIVKQALALNACALVVAHNHPSGTVNASEADRQLTRNLKQALALVEVRLLDHVIVAAGDFYSFAEAGCL
ncbi:DNA repair protein RadC [Methylomonas sp. HYX-M1]|uniref:RadC family protein n=1 Tax=Methylomonas sp. HYX-M1 TaxID=3139307 RepID=UPI00345B6D23